MTLLITFIIINCLFSLYLEKRKLHIATILHAVTFIVLLFFLLVTSNVSFINIALQTFFQDDIYDVLCQALDVSAFTYVSMITPFLLIELVVIISSFFIGLFLTILVVKEITEISTPLCRIKFFAICHELFYNKEKIFNTSIKVFLINERIRC